MVPFNNDAVLTYGGDQLVAIALILACMAIVFILSHLVGR